MNGAWAVNVIGMFLKLIVGYWKQSAKVHVITSCISLNLLSLLTYQLKQHTEHTERPRTESPSCAAMQCTCTNVWYGIHKRIVDCSLWARRRCSRRHLSSIVAVVRHHYCLKKAHASIDDARHTCNNNNSTVPAQRKQQQHLQHKTIVQGIKMPFGWYAIAMLMMMHKPGPVFFFFNLIL